MYFSCLVIFRIGRRATSMWLCSRWVNLICSGKVLQKLVRSHVSVMAGLGQHPKEVDDEDEAQILI